MPRAIASSQKLQLRFRRLLGFDRMADNSAFASHTRDEGEHVLDAIVGGTFVVQDRQSALWRSSDKSPALVETFGKEGVDVVVDR